MQSTKERLLVAVARYAKGKKGPLVLKEFCRGVGLSRETVQAHFGGFAHLLAAAGLSGRDHKRNGIGDLELLAELDRVAQELGRYPLWGELTKLGRFSWSVYHRRFGGMRGTRARYDRWREERGLPVMVERRAPSGLASSATSPAGGGGGRGKGRLRARRAAEFPLGEPVGHRVVMHAPTTEAGVIHIFGVLSAELGYAVASIRAAYPDCLAYKAGTIETDRWKPVRIEFELRSLNFLRHGHDPKGCDVIVCWEDDWKGCPVTVVELKRELERVRGRRESA